MPGNAAIVTYLGSISGNLGPAGSSALPQELNNVLFVNIVSGVGGGILERTNVEIQEESGDVVLQTSFYNNILPPGTAGAPLESGSTITPDGLAVIDWTNGGACATSPGVAGLPSVGTAPNGVAAVAPAANNVPFMAPGSHATPATANQFVLPAAQVTAFGLTANVLNGIGTDFQQEMDPSNNCSFTERTTTLNANGQNPANGGGISFPVCSEANGCGLAPGIPTLNVTAQ